MDFNPAHNISRQGIKTAKFITTTFAYHSTSYLFNVLSCWLYKKSEGCWKWVAALALFIRASKVSPAILLSSVEVCCTVLQQQHWLNFPNQLHNNAILVYLKGAQSWEFWLWGFFVQKALLGWRSRRKKKFLLNL